MRSMSRMVFEIVDRQDAFGHGVASVDRMRRLTESVSRCRPARTDGACAGDLAGAAATSGSVCGKSSAEIGKCAGESGRRRLDRDAVIALGRRKNDLDAWQSSASRPADASRCRSPTVSTQCCAHVDKKFVRSGQIEHGLQLRQLRSSSLDRVHGTHRTFVSLLVSGTFGLRAARGMSLSHASRIASRHVRERMLLHDAATLECDLRHAVDERGMLRPGRG